MPGSDVNIGVAAGRDAVGERRITVTAPKSCYPGISADEFKRKSAVFLHSSEAFVEAIHLAGIHINFEHGDGDQKSDGKGYHQFDQRHTLLAAKRRMARS